MRILMFTNTFTPFVSGVVRSVQTLQRELGRRGHDALIVAPRGDGTEETEEGVVRLPALQHFGGSEFGVPLPVPGRLARAVHRFAPDVVHSHHPFFLGDTALRVAAARGLPVVFTHHTRYEQRFHESERARRFVQELVTGYCGLCDAVIAPGESVAQVLRERGVTTRIEVIPAGVDVDSFATADGAAFRSSRGIPQDSFVIGHVGRLAPEKNLDFLCAAVVRALLQVPHSRFLVAGEGPCAADLRVRFERHGLDRRVHQAGILGREELARAYRAMDVFAFASRSETQGIVLAEALASAVPVVALDAPGVREILRDGENGRVVAGEDLEEFAGTIVEVARLAPEGRRHLQARALQSAQPFAAASTTGRMVELYESVVAGAPRSRKVGDTLWSRAGRRTEEEWRILSNVVHAAGAALRAPA